jgi:UDP-N-acetylglucosamine--dolichyl-phosphate N-acetylglucosaminephosphotransferase
MYVFYFIVTMFAMYGLTDDLFGFKGKIQKTWILFFLALPIATLTTDTSLNLIFFNLELGWAYAFIFAPLYIMVVANLINMHSGYNGLAGGLTLIMLVFAGIKSYLMNSSYYVYLIVPVVGALLAFMYYNKYPLKVFMGNVGAFLIGSALGTYLVISDIEFFGVIILIPHIINFILWIYWCLNMKKYPHVKFAKVGKDGVIVPPNGLTIKYLVAKVFKVNERQAVWICYEITIIFCIIGLLV